METRGLGAGSYPEPPETITKTVKVYGTFVTYITVELKAGQCGEDEFEEIEEQINSTSKYDLLEEVDRVEIEDYELI